jgi:hypothetical protein
MAALASVICSSVTPLQHPDTYAGRTGHDEAGATPGRSRPPSLPLREPVAGPAGRRYAAGLMF